MLYWCLCFLSPRFHFGLRPQLWTASPLPHNEVSRHCRDWSVCVRALLLSSVCHIWWAFHGFILTFFKPRVNNVPLFGFFIIPNCQNKNKKSKFIPLTKVLRCFLQCLTCTFPEACRWFALFFILVKRQYTHSCSQFRNAITPRQAFGYYSSDLQKLSGWVEIDFFRHLNKPREAGSGNWILDVMNIAGPSGTNKQLPKPPPPPRPLLSSMDLQKRENKLEILLCLISFP